MKIIASKPNETAVPNDFIDRLMPAANGEYVKVYLYLLRHAGRDVTIDEIADALELTGSDVSRAEAYWVKVGLIEDSQNKEDFQNKKNKEKKNSTIENSENAAKKNENCEKTDAFEEHFQEPDILKFKDNDEFSQLLFCLQQYLSAIFSQKETESVAYMYDVLKLPADLIEYLTEICVQKGKPSVKYIEAIARDWHSKGIFTLVQAKADTGIRYWANAGTTRQMPKVSKVERHNGAKVNKFNNFDQRNDDLDLEVLDDLKEILREE